MVCVEEDLDPHKNTVIKMIDKDGAYSNLENNEWIADQKINVKSVTMHSK